MFKSSLSSIFIMDANFAGLCENVNDFSMDEIFASDTFFSADNLKNLVNYPES